VIVAFAVGAAILLAMICVAWYGWVSLPSDARVPIHFGVSYNNFVPKRIGLVVHPAAGAVVFLILIFVNHLPAHGNSSKMTPYAIIPVIVCVMLVVQAGAIRLARRASSG
jgi:hypothetical protein